MSDAENFRVVLFLALIGVIYVLAAGVLLSRMLQGRKRSTLPMNPLLLWFRRIILMLAATGVLCLAYGYFVEPYWLSISRVRISSAKLPKGSQPIRIVHISDVHSDPKARLEDRLPQAIAAERPDVIVFTGDSLNSPEGLPIFRKLMTDLAKIAPTFVVRGNWDSWYWSDLNLFAGTGAQELNGTPSSINIRGVPIWLGGISVANEKMMPQMLSAMPPDAFKVFLYHYPDLINEAAERKVDLYVAGHTHGGQVALPFYGALITFSKFGKRYEAGLYTKGETSLYVSRGIGMEGGRAPRVRFWARPEVGVIEIVPVH